MSLIDTSGESEEERRKRLEEISRRLSEHSVKFDQPGAPVVADSRENGKSSPVLLALANVGPRPMIFIDSLAMFNEYDPSRFERAVLESIFETATGADVVRAPMWPTPKTATLAEMGLQVMEMPAPMEKPWVLMNQNTFERKRKKARPGRKHK